MNSHPRRRVAIHAFFAWNGCLFIWEFMSFMVHETLSCQMCSSIHLWLRILYNDIIYTKECDRKIININKFLNNYVSKKAWISLALIFFYFLLLLTTKRMNQIRDTIVTNLKNRELIPKKNINQWYSKKISLIKSLKNI